MISHKQLLEGKNIFLFAVTCDKMQLGRFNMLPYTVEKNLNVSDLIHNQRKRLSHLSRNLRLLQFHQTKSNFDTMITKTRAKEWSIIYAHGYI